MPIKAPPAFNLVKRDQKVRRLEDFLTRVLSNRTSSSPLLMLARSVESPVAKTMLRIGAERGHGPLAVRAIFTTLETSDTVHIAEACRAGWPLQIHWARDVRLMEAHEQLVLDGETTWIGDCMRREPSKHDAFEVFAEGCAETARRATVFFERIWKVSEPIVDRPAVDEELTTPVLEAPALAAAEPGESPPRTTVQ